MPGGREIIRLHRTLEGMLSLKEAAWLFRAGGRASRIVEIGSYRGKSCVIMARGSLALGDGAARIIAIDPHLVGKDSPRFDFHQRDRAVLQSAVCSFGVEHMVTEMVMTSREAFEKWDGSAIDLLWVDGDHSYEAARFDLESFGSLVRPGGVVAAHDYSARFPGVVRAWNEVMTASRGFGPTKRVRSLVSSVKRST